VAGRGTGRVTERDTPLLPVPDDPVLPSA